MDAAAFSAAWKRGWVIDSNHASSPMGNASTAARPIRSVLVLGGGSAGLIAALTLKRKRPHLRVEVVYSSKLGVIGVGEGTTPYVPGHFIGYLGFDEAAVFAALDPVFKLGVRFRWGAAEHFDYSFSGMQHPFRYPDLSRNSGFYQETPAQAIDLSSALMDECKVVPLRTDGQPDLPVAGNHLAWHIENHLFVEWLTKVCLAEGVVLTDAELGGVVPDGEGGIASLRLADGSERAADLFVDASGFASELLGKALAEPFVGFSRSLFCDRAVVGGWDRGDEMILPYTLSETMDAGWCWQIDHPHRIHRGYVYSSDHLTDEAAVEEYRRQVPKAGEPRIVRFVSGCYERPWVGNVVAVGNAAGFVEPLEATALMVICIQSRWLADGLIDSGDTPPPTMRELFCRMNRNLWRQIRDFLALHYRFNARRDTEFWRRCLEETCLGELEELVAFYQENGPSAIAGAMLDSNNSFGLDGYLVILSGLGVRHRREWTPPPEELKIWRAKLDRLRRIARNGLRMEELARRLKNPESWRRIRGG